MDDVPALRYEVAAADPAGHRGAFRLRVPNPGRHGVEIVFASWVPGSYWIPNKVRNVSGMRATDPATGAPLPVVRVGKARWRTEGRGAAEVEFRWEVYGNEIRTAWFDLTPEHMFLDAGFVLPLVEGRRDAPCEVTIECPAAWKVVTELPSVEGTGRTFRAEGYDELVDSPIDAGTPLVLATDVGGVPHRAVVCGEGGNLDPGRTIADLGKIAAAAHAIFGEVPMPGYTFFFHLGEGRRTGLEHRRSTSCRVPAGSFRPEKEYRKFLRLSAHEYFHLYNVKRIQPAAYARPDLEREAYSRLLWAMEGATMYFEDRLLLRAGLVAPARYLDELAETIRTYRRTPGRLHQSLEEASFASWVDFYFPCEETPNRSISYYVKGALVSLCLDLEVRARSRGSRSIDTLWRSLWETHGRTGRPIGEGELEPLLTSAAGFDLGPFFDEHVRGTGEVDFDRFLAGAGLRLTPRPKPRKADDGPEPGFLDVDLADSEGVARVSVVREGGPGARAGVSPGDEIVAIDGGRLRFADVGDALARYAPGDRIELTVFRRDRLRTLAVVLGETPPGELAIVPLPAADDAARNVHESWLGIPWSPPVAERPPA